MTTSPTRISPTGEPTDFTVETSNGQTLTLRLSNLRSGVLNITACLQNGQQIAFDAIDDEEVVLPLSLHMHSGRPAVVTAGMR